MNDQKEETNVKTKKQVNQARQGDVFLERIDAIPENAGPKRSAENGRTILAHGEATGHTHSFGSRAVSMYAVTDEFTRLGLAHVHLGRPAALRHQEHAPISFPAGAYRVVRQEQYDEGELVMVGD